MRKQSIHYNVSVTPIFHEDVDNNIKVNYSLKCHFSSTHSWITCAPFTIIASRGRTVQVKIDLNKLFNKNRYIPVYRGYIHGIDSNNVSLGPLFRIPVTICNHLTYPLINKQISPYNYGDDDDDDDDRKVSNNNNKYLYKSIDKFNVGRIVRLFHLVPTGASSAKIRIKCISTALDIKNNRFVFASLYNKNEQQFTYERWFRTETGQELSYTIINVESNTILETTLCQYSLSFGETIIEWSIEFEGPISISQPISMNINDKYSLIKLKTTTISCEGSNLLLPAVKFDTFNTYYKPQYGTINYNTLSSIGDIDISSSAPIYTLNLEYLFDQKILGSKNIIHFPLISNLLYESTYLGSFWMIFDSNKQLIASGEAFQQHQEFESGKLPKQNGLCCMLQLRSGSSKLLEKAKNSTLK